MTVSISGCLLVHWWHWMISADWVVTHLRKIENQEGINNIDEIIDATDGVMVARVGPSVLSFILGHFSSIWQQKMQKLGGSKRSMSIRELWRCLTTSLWMQVVTWAWKLILKKLVWCSALAAGGKKWQVSKGCANCIWNESVVWFEHEIQK